MTYQTYPHRTVVERVRGAATLTQRALGERAGLSVLYVIRAEQSIPQTLGDDLSHCLSRLTHQPEVIEKLPSHLRSSSPSYLEHEYSVDRLATLNFYKEQLFSHPTHDWWLDEAVGYALDNYSPGVGDRRGSRESHPLYLFRNKLMQLHNWPTSAIKFNHFFGLHASILSSIENRKDTIERNSATFNCLRDVLGVSEVQLEMLMKACDSCL